MRNDGLGICRAAWLCLALLASACAPSDEASLRTVPSSPTSPSPPTPPAAGSRLELSGRVVDDNGAPVPETHVEVDYPAGGGLSTRTNNLGEYSVEFDTRPWPPGRICGAAPESSCRSGFVYAFRDGYEVDVQWVPTGASRAVQDFRLRPTRSIPAGASTVVALDERSSLCTDLEDLWRFDSRCEVVVIASGAGTLTVEARSAAGGPAPTIFWYTSGNYAGLFTRPAPGTVAVPIRGGTYRILVAVPDGAPSQQFDVITTLR